MLACFRRILQSRHPPELEPIVDGHAGFLFFTKDGAPRNAMHWQKFFASAVAKHNKIYRLQLPKITPHVCRHEVFLHNVSAANLKNLVNRFDRYYRKLQCESLTDPEKAEELTELHETLSGKTMKSEELTAFLNNVLGISARDAQKLVTVSRLDPEKYLQEDTDFEIAPPTDPYENLDEEGLRAAKANERHELEGICQRRNRTSLSAG